MNEKYRCGPTCWVRNSYALYSSLKLLRQIIINTYWNSNKKMYKIEKVSHPYSLWFFCFITCITLSDAWKTYGCLRNECLKFIVPLEISTLLKVSTKWDSDVVFGKRTAQKIIYVFIEKPSTVSLIRPQCKILITDLSYYL